jgi:hypothetical protein
MAKKKRKPARAGGRVTPKGTQPQGTRSGPDSAPSAEVDHRPVAHIDPAHNRRASGPQGPTRAGHHHGQR